MTSQINPNNINGSYPVAGQDNNSQGFRDNFTNTATNFQYAANEITDLQNNAVLKAPLSGTTLNNNMNGSILSNAQLQQISATFVNLGTLGGSIPINYQAGQYQSVTTGGPISLNISNWPSAGVAGWITVQIYVSDTSHTVTFQSNVILNAIGIQGFNPDNNTITFNSIGFYTFQFVTYDNGSAVTVNQFNQSLQPFNASSENLTNGMPVSLNVTTDYFSPTVPSTAVLSAGINGQIKTFSMIGGTSTMSITVTNAGWKNGLPGYIAFNAAGDGCILQSINGNWFIIGNNSITIS